MGLKVSFSRVKADTTREQLLRQSWEETHYGLWCGDILFPKIREMLIRQ